MSPLWNTTLALLVLSTAAPPARAAEIKVLSAAAVGSGLNAEVALYANRSNDHVTVEFATGPEILERVSRGETPDVVVAPEAAMKTLAGAGKLGAPPFTLGRVGISLAVREGARRPDISSVAALKAAVLGARTVIYSKGTSGTYLAGMMDRLGLAQAIADRTERVENGAGVVARLSRGTGDEIGFSASTELALGVGHGLVIVAALPTEVQNYTTYSAAPSAAAGPQAAGLVALLRGPEGKAAMAANGVD